MATVTPFPTRNCYRIRYTLAIESNKIRRAKYAQTKSEAVTLAHSLTHLEQATRTGIAPYTDIVDWIQRSWISPDEAATAFVGYSRADMHSQVETDYSLILSAYAAYSERHTKDSVYNKSHSINMGRAKKIIEWLQANHPDLSVLSRPHVESFIDELNRQQYAPWTMSHYLTALRILLDRAMNLKMISDNPARDVTVRQPKRVKQRRILDKSEIDWLLERSLHYPQWINGAFPTLVRLGLYAGLRNQEMIWLRWDAIDWEKRIITIAASRCEATGETWTPKDSEMRRLDVKEAMISHLRWEQERQRQDGVLSPFVMPGGGGTRPKDFREKPLSPIAVQRAFKRFLQAEGQSDSGITIYCLRHTYCTMLLRHPPLGAGIDIRTVQQRMGHSDIKTTMEYLHYIDPESHPTDRLPY